jgi:uncharacterized membrane protein YsdA (DUF1294 family)/cold shock CspA family protein
MRYQGRITQWNDDKGFGFVLPNGASDKVFIHVSAFSSRRRRPQGGELVTYELATDAKGRAQAKSVAFVGERAARVTASGRSSIAPVFAVCFLVFLVAAVIVGRLPVATLVLYGVASALAFLAYAFDKSAASRNAWRTRESTLHLFALAGGWPGALAAQRLLRHKSAKQSFQAMFWVTVVLNCATLGWCFSSAGASSLEAVGITVLAKHIP